MIGRRWVNIEVFREAALSYFVFQVIGGARMK